jgi:hypothetical protein
MSLPVSKQQRQLSSSNPDLAVSNPGSPDTEIAGLIGKIKDFFSLLETDLSDVQEVDV